MNQYNDLEKYFKDQEQKSGKPVDKINIDDNKINIEPNNTIKGGNRITKVSKFKLSSYPNQKIKTLFHYCN